MSDVRFRALTPDDQDALWDWLHIALWDPPPAALRPREVLEDPRARIRSSYHLMVASRPA